MNRKLKQRLAYMWWINHLRERTFLKEKIIRDKGCLGFYDWIIIGAQTNPLKLPQKEWVESLTRRAKNLNIPVFHKENLAGLDIELLKEFPF